MQRVNAKNVMWRFRENLSVHRDWQWNLRLVRHVMTRPLINMEFTGNTTDAMDTLSSLSVCSCCSSHVCSPHLFIDLWITSIHRHQSLQYIIHKHKRVFKMVSSSESNTAQLITNPCYPRPACSTVYAIIRLVLLAVCLIRNIPVFKTQAVTNHCDSWLKTLSSWWLSLAALWR